MKLLKLVLGNTTKVLTIIFLQHSNSRSSRDSIDNLYDEDDPGGNDFF